MLTNEPLSGSFSLPRRLTPINVDSLDENIAGVYMISPSPSLEVAGALTIESGNIRSGLQRFIANSSAISLFFMYHTTNMIE